MARGPERFAAATAHLPITPQRMPASTHTAAEAAAAVGCEVGAIVKSLVFVAVYARTPDSAPDSDSAPDPESAPDPVLRREPVLALVCGDNRADLDALAQVLGAQVEKADAATVKTATGYSIGGVPPVGHPTPVRTIVDRDLLRFDTVWSAAGSATDVFAATPQQLVEWSSGDLAAIGSR